MYPVPSAPRWNKTERPVMMMGSMGEMKKQQHTWAMELEQGEMKKQQHTWGLELEQGEMKKQQHT